MEKNGPGSTAAAHLLEHDHEVDEVEPGAAVLLGQDEPHPAELGHLLPQLAGEADLVLHHLADEGHGRFLREEVARRAAQHLLLFAEAEIHWGILAARALRRQAGRAFQK